MPGSYAHISIVKVLCNSNRLDKLPGLSDDIKLALTQNSKFCELGAVSPDYPFLAIFSKKAKQWGDTMHYRQTADTIRAGIGQVINFNGGDDKNKAIAWLFGYAAHVVADLTVHPIVRLKVGDYESNALEHRWCEMNQDVHILERLGFSEVSTVNQIHAGIGECNDPNHKLRLHPAIHRIWSATLQEVFPKDFGNNAPRFDEWHDAYVTMICNVANQGKRLFLFRRFAEDNAYVFPEPGKEDPRFIESLACPDGANRNYWDVFNLAAEKVTATWSEIGQALRQGNPQLLSLKNGNLDTGLIEGPSIFWS